MRGGSGSTSMVRRASPHPDWEPGGSTPGGNWVKLCQAPGYFRVQVVTGLGWCEGQIATSCE
jgi:hypothetical protein